MAPVRLGILGAAKIGRQALIEPAKARGDVALAAVAARDGERARAYAEKYGFARAYEGYQALIDDPAVDAVYIALPQSTHARWTVAALEAGKAVLCEKPLCLDAVEARTMADAAARTGVLLMEAFHYRYHPLFARVLQIVGSGEIGALRRIEMVCEVPTPDGPGELRYDPDLGGGALMDLGAYCVHVCRSITGAEPRIVSAEEKRIPGGVDVRTEAVLAFPGGVEARIVCGFEEGPRADFTVEGEGGALAAQNPLLPQFGNRLTVSAGGEDRVERMTREPSYGFQLAAFLEALAGGPAPPTSGEDLVAQMVAIDAIKAATRG